MAARERIFLVVGGGLVLAGYRGVNAMQNATMHSRCIAGAGVMPCDLLERLPEEIRTDLAIEFDARDEDDTPIGDATTVLALNLDDIEG